MLYLKCEGQVVKIVEDERLADKYINANTVHFEFCERWDGMVITAQFTQKQGEENNTFNVLVDEITHTVTMPNEIEAGKVDISAFGVHPQTGARITTIPVTKTVDKSGFVGDGETPIPPTPDLYAQLIAKIDDAEGNQAEQIQNAVDNYLDENPVQTGATQEQAEQIEANKQAIEANKQAIENYTPPVTSVNGMTGDVVIETGGGAADSIEWNKVTGKPVTYPPDAHTHSYNDLANKPSIPVVPNFLPNPYALTINGQSYNGSEPINVTVSGGGGTADSVAWENVTGKPTAYPPEGHTHSLSSLGALGKDETAVDANALNGKSADEYLLKANAFTMERLWQNGAPSSSFVAHTLSEDELSLAGWDKIIIVFDSVADRGVYCSAFMDLNVANCETVTVDKNGKFLTRKVLKSGNQLEFAHGYKYETYGTYVSDDSAMIPVFIYGVKGVSE